MKILDRYILKQLIVAFVVVLASMTLLVWLTQSLRMIDMIVTRGVAVRVFLQLTLLVLPGFMQILFPLVLFAVALFVYVRMQSDKELMVMSAVGMSARQLIRPVFMFAVALTIFGYILSLFLIPYATAEMRELRWKVKNNISHLLLQEGQFNSFRNGLTLYIKERTPDGRVSGIFAYEVKDKERKSVMVAQSGTVFQADEGIKAILNNGVRQEFNTNTQKFSVLKFDKYTMMFSDKNDATGKRSDDVREMPLKKLLTSRESDVDAAMYRRYKVEALRRVTQPLYTFVFMLLAMYGVLTGFYNRRGHSEKIHFVIVGALLIQSLALLFENMARKNLLFMGLMALNILIPLVVLYVLLFRAPKWRARRRGKAVIFLLMFFAVPAVALPKLDVDGLSQDRPVDFEADKVVYNQKDNTLTARGDVVFEQSGLRFKTQEIIFNQSENTAVVPGEIILTSPEGNVSTIRGMTLSDRMTEILGGAMTAKFVDGTYMTADEMQRTNAGNTVYLRQATYTPCDVCEDMAPLWQFRAKTIEQDNVDHTIAYKHVFLDVKDTPVLYMPYFKMPDFSVKRKTGLLTPNIGHTSTLGMNVGLPVFVDLGENQNLTLTPIIATNQAPLGLLHYEGVFERGMLDLQFSATRDSDRQAQAHALARFEYDVDDNWRLKGQYFRTATDTYFRRYSIPNVDESRPFLMSDITAERFGDRNYFRATGYSFQSLLGGVDSRSIPIILPVLDYSYQTQSLGDTGLYAFSNVNSALYNTREHFKSNRLSLTQGIHMPYISATGLSVELEGSVRLDGYMIDTGERQVANKDANDVYEAFRFYPSASIKMSYPLANRTKNITHVIEPIIMAVATPNGLNDEKIPNLDSTVFDFSDANLFSTNRFAGYDRIESGPRVNYGVQWSAYHDKSAGTFSMLFGQTYRLHREDEMLNVMGYEKNFSDFVGRIQWNHDLIRAAYHFRLDQEDLEAKKHQLTLEVGSDVLRVGVDYIYIAPYEMGYVNFGEREEVLLYGRSRLAKDWQVGGYYRYDLEKDGGPIEYGGNLRYDNECTAFILEAEKSFTSDRDYRGKTSVMFRVILKTLGGMT